jgi:glycosyltransferase involved in cell wall biosynthesis
MIKVMFTVLLLGLIAAAGLVILFTFIRLEGALSRHKYRPVAADVELPTVSVCIPARNEMHAMTECLERVIASEYPKLEIIVLDDSSVDDTSVLIKSFAHAGVRFVDGRALPDGWLGKNNALQGLLEEASGRYILFLDVDTTLKPHSITRIASQLVASDLPLISVMPQREDGLRASIFLGTLRYFWVLLTGSTKNPAVSAATWLVSRQKLLGLGGFERYKDHTQPEIAIAHELGATSGKQLIISTKELGVSYEKKWSSQVETSTRLLRPLFGSSMMAIFAATLLFLCVIAPIGGFVIFLLSSFAAGVYLSVAVLLLATLLSLRFFKVAWRYGWWLGAVHWPYVVLQEAVLVLVSVLSYARGSVTWKARPIKNSQR